VRRTRCDDVIAVNYHAAWRGLSGTRIGRQRVSSMCRVLSDIIILATAAANKRKCSFKNYRPRQERVTSVLYCCLPRQMRKTHASILFRRITRMKSHTKASYEMVHIDRLAKVTNDAILQSAVPDIVIGVGCEENRRDLVPRLDEVSVEFDTGHHRHMNVSDQAGRFGQMRRCEEIACR
jgi:hypothetical protein